MRSRTVATAVALLVALAMLIGPLWTFGTQAQGDPGTITVTKTWAPGEEPGETVEVCFAVTSDADGVNVLVDACTTDDTYTVTFDSGDLVTGTTYYVWEDTGAGWTVTGDNPVEVVIPADSGEAFVEFENQRAGDTATITIHKAVCPETTEDLYGVCHEERVPDVNFVIGDDRVTTDEEGVAEADVPAGEVQITEAEADFGENATAGAAWVYCAVMPGGDPVLYDDLANHRSIEIEAPAGSTVVCDWYDLTAEGPQPATLELHKRVCPADITIGDIFEDCHDILPEQEVTFSLDDTSDQAIDENGNVSFTDLAAGTHTVTETEGPPLEFVELRVYCSLQGSDAGPFQVSTDGPSFDIEIGEGELLICDAYNVALDLSGGPTVPTNTPEPIEPDPTNTPEPPTETPTPEPPTATPTPTPFIGRPVFIYEGSCFDLDDDDPLVDLNGLTTPEAGLSGSESATVVESSYTVIDISLDELLDDDHAINAVISDEERGDFVTCGEIGGPVRDDGSIIVGLREQDGYGLSGVAYLSPLDGGQTAISIFLAPGLAEEDPNLLPPPGDEVMIRSVVNNGPVDPESQEGYEITILGDGDVEIVITPQGASDDLGDDATEVQEIITLELDDEKLLELLVDLHEIGFFDLTQEDDINPDVITVGGDVSALTVTVVDGTWEVNGNGLSGDEADILEEAQEIVEDAVGGVDL